MGGVFYCSNCIVNRRQSLAHPNFRKAIYRSLSLADGDARAANESNHAGVRYQQHLIKFLVACLLIVLTGSLIRFLRPLPKS